MHVCLLLGQLFSSNWEEPEASPTLASPTLASPTLAGPTLAGPTLAGPTLAGPTLAGPTLARPIQAKSLSSSVVCMCLCPYLHFIDKTSVKYSLSFSLSAYFCSFSILFRSFLYTSPGLFSDSGGTFIGSWSGKCSIPFAEAECQEPH